MPSLPSTAYVRLVSPSPAESPNPARLTKSPPSDDRFGSSRLTRTTPKLLPGVELVVARLHVEEPDVEVSGLARHAAAPQDRDGLAVVGEADAPAEEQLHLARVAHREEPGVLEEERALLGKEQVEAIEVHLLVVDLDLGEVGVDGAVDREARRDGVLQVAPDVAEQHAVGRHGAGLERVAERVRRDLQVPERGDLDAGDRTRRARAGRGCTAAGSAPRTTVRCAAGCCAGS